MASQRGMSAGGWSGALALAAAPGPVRGLRLRSAQLALAGDAPTVFACERRPSAVHRRRAHNLPPTATTSRRTLVH